MLFFNSPWGFPDRGHSPSAPPKGSETCLKPLGNTFRLTISESLLLRLQHHCSILFFSCRNDVLILYVLVSLPEKRAKPRERPQKGLKPVWNHSETPSGSPSQTLSMLLRLQHHCFILFFRCRNDVLIWFVLVSWPDHFEGQCPYLSSASFPGNWQRPVSAPKGVWNRSETTLKRLPAHHLRLSIYACSFDPPWHCFIQPSVCKFFPESVVENKKMDPQ